MRPRESDAQRRRRLRQEEAARKELTGDDIYTRRADPRLTAVPNDASGRRTVDPYSAADRGRREAERTAKGGRGARRRAERHANAEARADREATRQLNREKRRKPSGRRVGPKPTAGQRLPIGQGRPLELMPGPPVRPTIDHLPPTSGYKRPRMGGRPIPEQWWETEARRRAGGAIPMGAGELGAKEAAMWEARKVGMKLRGEGRKLASTMWKHKGKSALAAGVVVGGLALSHSTGRSSDRTVGHPTGMYGY